MSWLFRFNCVALALQMYRSLQWPPCHLYCARPAVAALSCCLHPFPPTTTQLHILTLLGCKPDTFSVCPGGPIPLHTANALQLCRLMLLTLYCTFSNASPCSSSQGYYPSQSLALVVNLSNTLERWRTIRTPNKQVGNLRPTQVK